MTYDQLINQSEALIRKYKRIRLVERDYLRVNCKKNNEQVNIVRIKEAQLSQFIQELEVLLGYKVHLNPQRTVRANTIQERLNAI